MIFPPVHGICHCCMKQNPRPFVSWKKLKQRLKEDENETVTNCHQLKMRATDGKMRCGNETKPPSLCFPQSFAGICIHQINYIIEQQLAEKSGKADDFINAGNYLDKIFDLGVEYIIVFINRSDIYKLLLQDQKFVWTDRRRRGFFLGKTGKKASVYMYTDVMDKQPRVFMFKKKQTSQLSKKIDIRIDDFNESNDILEVTIKEQPYWLKVYCPQQEKQREYLRQQVRISVEGEICFGSEENMVVYMFC